MQTEKPHEYFHTGLHPALLVKMQSFGHKSQARKIGPLHAVFQEQNDHRECYRIRKL
jgi:hypothetical protein